MDKSLQYAQVMSNFDSAYNISPTLSHRPTVYIPMSSSTTFSTFPNRSSSPLFRRSTSPPSRSPISTGSALKFNFDLYQMDENNNEYDDYLSPSYRSISPPSSRIIHHRPIHSPPTSKSQTLSKLRQINDELCRTLARTELRDQPQQAPPHYHIHHYPVSQNTYKKHRSRSTSDDHSSSAELKVSPKLHKARVTYKIHIPRRHRQEQQQQHRKSSRSKLDQGHISTSDDYSSDDSMTVDLYPTRDHGFVKQIRKHSDNRSPWLVDGTSLRRSSYSDANTSRSPKRRYYGDKPVKPHSRSVRGKERHQSPFVSSRIRPGSAPLHASDPFRETNGSFSNNERVWRPTGSIKRPKFIGSHAPPSSKAKHSSREAPWSPAGDAHKTKYVRTFDPRNESPSSRTREPVWHPPSKIVSERPSKYFEPTLKPEYDVPSGKRSNDGTESEPVSQRKSLSNRTKILNGDPKLKKRIAKAESKVKSAWESTATGLTQSTVKEPKPPISHPVKKTTITTPPKSKGKSVPSEPAASTKRVATPPPTTTNTGRTSSNDVPKKPMFESTPRNENAIDENDDSVTNLFETESETSQRSEKQELPRPPPQVEKPPTELPKISVPEPSKGTKTTAKDGVLIQGSEAETIQDKNQKPSTSSKVNNDNDDEESSDARSVQPTPPPPPKVPTTERKAAQPKPNNDSVVDDDRDENDEEVARSFDIKKWLDGASKTIFDASKKGDTVTPSTPPRPPPPPTANPKPPVRRKEQPPSPPPSGSPDHNLYKPPFGPKKTEEKKAVIPPPPPTTTTAGGTDEVDDFFN